MRWMTSIVMGILTSAGMLVLIGIVGAVVFLMLLESYSSARNLEKYHCVDQELMAANPYDKTPNFYGYHIILGGDKRGLIARKERSLRIVSAQNGVKLSRKVQLRPIGYNASFCYPLTNTGENYHFTDYPLVPAKLEVSWMTEGSENIEKNVFQCSRYEDIHLHRYYNLQRGHPPLAPRDTSGEVRLCPQ